MADEAEELTKEQEYQLASKFEEAAIGLALTANHCNRFFMISLGGITSLVFGSGAMSTNMKTGEVNCVGHAVAGVTFNKRLAMDLVVFLEKHFEISEADRENARKRFSDVLGT